MTVYVSINGVLRDFWSKFHQEYRKYYLEAEPTEEETFEYKILNETSPEIMERFAFQSEDEMKYFLYVDFPMEIFGHAAPVYKNVMQDLLNWQKQEGVQVVLVSEEYGKSIPATLFFLAKTIATFNEIKFYRKEDIEELWEECDVWITDDPKVIRAIPESHGILIKKECIKVAAPYNLDIPADVTINKISDLIKDEQTEKSQEHG